MCKRYFISFLGVTDYKTTNYYTDGYRDSEPEKYIQISTIHYLNIDEWEDNDEIIILMTEKSRQSNWLGNNGLEQRIKQLGLKCKVKDILIPAGNQENELWDIYYTVLTHIDDNAELYVDITHSFRSLPMLFTVILHQLNNLKNVRIKSITYGSYESRNQNNESPIIDLTLFSSIMDIIDFTHQTKKFGFSFDKENVIERLLKNLGNKYKGQNNLHNSIREFFGLISNFSKFIYYCNAPELINGDILRKILQDYNQIMTTNDYDPLLNTLKQLCIALFQDLNQAFELSVRQNIQNDDRNLFFAAQYCAKHFLYQQGFTFLQEGIKNIFRNKYLQSYESRLITNNNSRQDIQIFDFISSFLNYGDKNENSWKGILLDNKDFAIYLRNSGIIDNRIFGLYSKITESRNKINHAHFGGNYSNKYDEILQQYIKEVFSIF